MLSIETHAVSLTIVPMGVQSSRFLVKRCYPERLPYIYHLIESLIGRMLKRMILSKGDVGPRLNRVNTYWIVSAVS